MLSAITKKVLALSTVGAVAVAAASFAVFCGALTGCGGGGASATPAVVAANITWSTSSVEPILSPGESGSTNLTFRSDQALQNATIEASGSIASLVTITPNSIANVPAGQDQAVKLTFSIPAGTALGSVNGTIQVKNGGLTLPQTVNVVVDVWQSFTDLNVGVSFHYPPGLFAFSQSGRVLVQTSANEINLGGALPEQPTTMSSTGYVITFRTDLYSKPFSLAQWLTDVYPYSVADSTSNVVISGISSFQITLGSEVGAGEPITVVPETGKVLQISYASTFDTSSNDEVSGLATYNKVLQTVHAQ